MEAIKELFAKDYLNLFLAQLSTHLGDSIIQIALMSILLNTVEKPGSLIALMLFAFVLPSLIVSMVAGSIVDRFSRKKVMILSALYRGFVLIASLGLYFFIIDKTTFESMVHIYGIILSLIIGIGTAFFYPAKMAAVPNVVSVSALKPANALVSGSGTWALTFGALVASIILLKIGVLNLLFIAIALYFVACVFLHFVKLKNDNDSQDKNFDFIKDIQSMTNFLVLHKKALNMILLAVVISLISVIFYNSMNALATDYYQVSVTGLAQLKCMLGCGTFYGAILMIFFSKSFKTNKTLVISFIGLFLCLITASFCTTFVKARFWLGAIGIFASILKITVDTILQKVSPNFIRGKIFAFASMLETFASLLGIGFVSLFVGIIHPIAIFHIIAAISALMAVTLLVLNKEFRYFVLRITIGQIFKCLFRYQFEGIDNIPKYGKVILAGNHTGHLDPLILQMATKRNLWFITGPAAFKIPVIKHMLK